MKRKIFRAAIVLFILLLLSAGAALLFPQRVLTVDSGPAKADVIVVLGGGLHERSERAAELFQEHVAPRIIITGFGDDEINRRLLLKNGVPADLIETERKSTTTRQNAEFTIKLLRAENVRRAILVTSWYHSRRGLATFRHFAPDLKFYSRPSYFEFQRQDWSREMRKKIYWEYAKLPRYWICYGIWPF